MVLQQFIDRTDRAVGAVFNGQHAEFAKAGLHRGDHGLEGLDIDDVAPGQQTVAGHLGVGALYALAGHKACLGEHRAAGLQRGLDLSLHPGGGTDELGLSGAGQLEEGGKEMVSVAFLLSGLFRHPGQDCPLPFLVEDGQMMLVFIGGHFLRQGHALQEQLQELVVNGVNFFSNFRKFHDAPPIKDLIKPSR